MLAAAGSHPLHRDYVQLPEMVLVAHCQQGELEAFNVLISRYEHKVYNLALRYLREPHSALDEAQEIFLKVFRRIRSFRGRSAFGTWLYRVATNHCLHALEKRKHRPTHRAHSLDDTQETQVWHWLEDPKAVRPDQALIEKELSHQMSEAIARLPPDQQQVIILCHYEEMSYEAAAKVLEVPVTTVASCLHRARQQLRRSFAPKGGGRP